MFILIISTEERNNGIFMQRRQIIFSGRVQGVGFRFTAESIASNLNLTGWVKNNSDGTVTMEVQGEYFNIYQLLKELTSDSYIQIENVNSRTIDLVTSETKFRTIY